MHFTITILSTDPTVHTYHYHLFISGPLSFHPDPQDPEEDVQAQASC